jgi:mRNA deadenylase 3'-5' endonuclease subunit Ccr4
MIWLEAAWMQLLGTFDFLFYRVLSDQRRWRKLHVTPHVGASFAWNHRKALFLQETPYFAVKIAKNT